MPAHTTLLSGGWHIVFLIQKKYLLLRYTPILFFGAGIHYSLKRVLEIPRPEKVLL